MSDGRRSHQVRRFPTFWHLKSIAIVATLAASGLISLLDFTLVSLSIIYIFFLSSFSFPAISAHQDTPIFPNNRILPIYVLFAAAAGLVGPIFYILEGIYEGDKQGVAAAAPHLFLLATQVVMEGVAASQQFSTPVRAFVPVFYNSWRIPAVVEWVRGEVTAERGEAHQMRAVVGRALALVNLLLWSYNLFGFLVPVYLPRAFKRYYAINDDASSGSKVE